MEYYKKATVKKSNKNSRLKSLPSYLIKKALKRKIKILSIFVKISKHFSIRETAEKYLFRIVILSFVIQEVG